MITLFLIYMLTKYKVSEHLPIAMLITLLLDIVLTALICDTFVTIMKLKGC